MKTAFTLFFFYMWIQTLKKKTLFLHDELQRNKFSVKSLPEVYIHICSYLYNYIFIYQSIYLPGHYPLKYFVIVAVSQLNLKQVDSLIFSIAETSSSETT